MFLTAPETKGKTLEEMDEVFDSGRPAWRRAPKGSRLDALQEEIERGELKIGGGAIDAFRGNSVGSHIELYKY
jgi:hypothetical protein